MAPPALSRRARARLVLVLVPLVAVLAGRAACSRTSDVAVAPGGSRATVVAVVDGDTVRVARGGGAPATVRLIGIDTPETKRPGTPIECFGPEAAARTAELLPPGTEVLLEPDEERTDRYDRELAYLHRVADGRFVNLDLVRDGFAASYPYPPNVAHLDELQGAADDARAEGRGLWSACGSPHRRR